MSFNQLLVLVVVFFFGSSRSGEAGLTIGGTTKANGFSYPDPAGGGDNISFTVSKVTYATAPIAGSTFATIFASQSPGWTLSYGGGLSGSLNVNTYSSNKATNGDGSFNGSLTMNATYTPAAGDPTGLTFIQYYTQMDNNDNGVSHNLQILDNSLNRNSGLPIYYNPQLMLNNGLTFKDTPSDPMPSQANAYQIYINKFYTYMCTFDSNNKTLTVYDGWHWGYSTGVAMPFVTGTVPEPASFLGLIAGLTISFFAAKRRLLH